MLSSHATIDFVFFATLLLTFCAALYARFRASSSSFEDDLAGRNLNRWLVGLSAGTTGNSGFIVTGAVGLGFSGGVHWILLPVSWLLGDLIFWSLFPDRLNNLARKANAVTLSELLTFDLTGRLAKLLAIAVAFLLATFLSAYTAAQWLAGKKFLASAFALSDFSALLVFASTIVLYSSIGGFRGSVYTDLVQAVIRIIGTVIAMVTVVYFAFIDGNFSANIAAAGPDFLILFPNATVVSLVGFVAGYCCAAVGFGLGQPQIVSRYLAGRSPEETKAARWIYIGFIQFTWISMTAFGVLLRGLMPGLADPETGLIVFAQQSIWPIAAGIIFADIFATIASTANGLLVAIAQTIRRDVFERVFRTPNMSPRLTMATTFFVGVATIGLSFTLPGNVFSIAIDAVSMIGAGLAGPIVIKLFGWRHSGSSLFLALCSGITAAIVWKYSGAASVLNEAGVGIAASLVTNLVVIRIAGASDRQGRTISP